MNLAGRRLRYNLAVAALLALAGVGIWLAATRYLADHHLREAHKALQKDRIDDARTHLARSLDMRPRSASVQFLAARTARRAGAHEEAKQHLRRSKELGWDETAVMLEEVLIEAQSDPRRYAGYLFGCVKRDHPDSEAILEVLSRGYLNLFDLPKALHCLDTWLERNPNAIRGLTWRGYTLERLERREQSRQDFQRVVDLDAEHDEARTRLAKSLLKDRNMQEAAAHFELLSQRRPEDIQVLRGLALCRQEQDRREEAEQLLDRAFAVNPDDMLTLTQRGRLALETGRLEEAEDSLRRAVTLAPFEREPVFNFSRCLQARGKHQEAQQWLDRLAQVETDLAAVKKLVTQVLATPADPNPRHELGVIYLRNGQEKEGLRWLQSALLCDPRQRATHRVLADYFEKQGQPELASQHRQLAQ